MVMDKLKIITTLREDQRYHIHKADKLRMAHYPVDIIQPHEDAAKNIGEAIKIVEGSDGQA